MDAASGFDMQTARQGPDGSGAFPADPWRAAYDANSGKYYYYDVVTGERSWDPPPGWVAADAAVGEERPAPSAPAASEAALPGYFYQDAYGITQGPYSKAQLLAWRGALPMDLLVWYRASSDRGGSHAEVAGTSSREQRDEPGAPATHEDTSNEEGGGTSTPPGGGVENQEGAAEDGASVDPPIEGRQLQELATVLGDSALLASWRSENAHLAGRPCASPSAAAFERDQSLDTYTSLAEAALAGLPATDEAVHLAHMASQAGRSIRDVVAWSQQGGEDYTAVAMHSAGRGRVQAAGGASSSLYAEMGAWVNPETVEAQMRAAAERRKRPLAPGEVREIRRRKQEMKERNARQWLLD